MRREVTAGVGPYDVGDWMVSNGAVWTRLAFGGGMAAVIASAVAVNPAVEGQTDVQAALEALSANKVTGPTAAVTDTIAVYDGITGVLIKDGGVTIADPEIWATLARKITGRRICLVKN